MRHKLAQCILAFTISVAMNCLIYFLPNDWKSSGFSIARYEKGLEPEIRTVINSALEDINIRLYDHILVLPKNLDIITAKNAATEALKISLADATYLVNSSLTQTCAAIRNLNLPQNKLLELPLFQANLSAQKTFINKAQTVLDTEKAILVELFAPHKVEPKEEILTFITRTLAFALCLLMLLNSMPTKTQTE